jgi:hypothetical protein
MLGTNGKEAIMFFRTLCGAFLACISAVVFADSPSETIPLKDIWALDMPGTKNLRELDGKLIDQIAAALPYLSSNQTAKPERGFAVRGEDRQALAEAANILTQGVQSKNSFAPNDHMTLVFFSHPCGQYLYIQKIERQNFTITVSYEFIPHDSKDMAAQFALIPLGTLPAGKYDVEYVPLPLDSKFVNQGYKAAKPEYVTCKSFSFTVGGQQ